MAAATHLRDHLGLNYGAIPSAPAPARVSCADTLPGGSTRSSTAYAPSETDSVPSWRFKPARELLRRVRPPALTLVNSGSVARDHLASERTFLAYVRTSLAISSMGVALSQLFQMSAEMSGRPSEIHKFGRPLGAMLVILGFFVLALGTIRYFTVQSALVEGKFPAARTAITIVSCCLAASVVGVFAILLGMSTATA